MRRGLGLTPQVGAKRLLQHLVGLLKNKPACEQHQSCEEQMFFWTRISHARRLISEFKGQIILFPELKDLRKRGFIAYFRGTEIVHRRRNEEINKREDTVRSPSSATADQLLPEKNQQSSRMTRSNGKSGKSPTPRITNHGANRKNKWGGFNIFFDFLVQ